MDIAEWRHLSRQKIVNYLQDHPAELQVLAQTVTLEELGLHYLPVSGGRTTRQKNMLSSTAREAATTTTSLRPNSYSSISISPRITVALPLSTWLHELLDGPSMSSWCTLMEQLTKRCRSFRIYGQLDGIPNAPLSGPPVQLAFMNDNHFEPLLPANQRAVFFDSASAWLNTVWRRQRQSV